MPYAWIIDRDHLDESITAEERGFAAMRSEVGTTGPSTATADDLARLAAGEGDVFTMSDDDGFLYYTGRAVVSGDTTWEHEESCAGPLLDFGQPNAGCVEITWPGHPERDCG